MDAAQPTDPVLVTGATGKQGGATARALLARGIEVRALVRDPSSEPARAIESLGASLFVGDLNDQSSLVKAATGARAVFSVQMPDMTDLEGDGEKNQGRNLVEAAREANVPQFVHTSASGVGAYHRSAPGWNEGRWAPTLVHYWESKAYIDELVRAGGFSSWTILHPAFFMENFVRPSFLFANWVDDRFLTAIAADTKLALIAVDDIGAAAAAAVDAPEKFHKADVELAGDYLTLTEVAAMMSDALGTHIAPPAHTPEEALADGLMPAFVDSQRWMSEFGSGPARPEDAQAMGLTTTDFVTWASKKLKPTA